MNSVTLLSRHSSGVLNQCRSLVRPPRNLPYRGIYRFVSYFFFVFLAGLYRTEGETVRKGELLVCQGKFNYHPGLNVSASFCF